MLRANNLIRLSRTTAAAALAAGRRKPICYLSTFEKHRDTLEKLGIEKTNNKGVFDGEWKGSGELTASLNPVNNEVIAEVVTVCERTSQHKCMKNRVNNLVTVYQGSTQDLSTALDRVAEAQKIWREVCSCFRAPSS